MSAHGLGLQARQRDAQLHAVVRRHVGDRDIDFAVLAPGRRRVEGRDLAAGDVDFRRLSLQRDRRRILEGHVHLVGVVGRGQHHLVALGQDDRLKDIDGLGDVRHPHALGVLVEDVEVRRRQHAVAQGVQLIEVAGVRAGFGVIPGAPLVHIEPDTLLGIIAIHHRDVLAKQIVHPQGLRERLAPGGLVEACGRALLVPVTGLDRVVVQRDGVHLLARRLGQNVGPVHVK